MATYSNYIYFSGNRKEHMDQILYKYEIPGIEVDRIVRDSGAIMPIKHFHDDYEIYYLYAGSRNYFIGQDSYLVEAGGLVLIDSQEIHRTSQHEKPFHDRLLIEIKEEPFGSFFGATKEVSLSGLFSHTNCVLQLEHTERETVEALLGELTHTLDKREVGYRLKSMTLITEVLLFAMSLLQKREVIPKEPRKQDSGRHILVSDAASYISAHYHETLTLELLAEHFYVNKSYLSRVFKEITGFTVHEYLNVNRIKASQRLLISGRSSITDISEQLGYESITYFEKIFKKFTGLTPREFRRKNT